MVTTALLDRLRRVPLFAGLPEERLRWLAGAGEEVRLAAGQTLFAEGDPPRGFFVTLEGELAITKRAGGGETFLATHPPGAFGGEISLLTGAPHNATGRATRESRLLRLGPAAFREMLVSCAPVAQALFATMAGRLQQTEAAMRQGEKLLALGKLSAGLAHELNNPAAAGR
ncbi:MAG: cyclic nucleotide-binding domain-containing protein, partial [Chloroflexota bacterium]|nr:cyclic nucleotide-binding domain-containing protein [Chloroflexota bacterium]